MIWFAAYCLAGAIIGFLAGLLGIGGGMMLVPILAALFTAQQFAPDHVVHLALGTGMASIMFTSAASTRAHARLGAVDFALVWKIAPGMVAGSLASALAAGWIEQRALALAFAVIVYAGATQILLNRKPSPGRTVPGPIPLLCVGFAIGIICGLVSAGGAFLTVPFMLWCGIPIHRAIGTGSMLGIPVAMVGTIGYLVSGWSTPHLPADALGFVSLLALAGVSSGSMLTARLGARVSHRLPVLHLKRIFAFLLYALATKMLFTYW
ncbi:sulfite exporter TauE/SafE family protein [Lacisediminimonas profundi]|uniref:sulfite exporter TauE/SafE family protein n=1 Tax=Lacisediminimonas profundi TaxID=2603856 RepID=UPI00124B448A|nr:sulfite exporter TauE/SafE family protein [Lacisediminimonas profundi]